MTCKRPTNTSPRAGAPAAESDATFRERLNCEIEDGFRDVKAGRIITAAEHRARMDRFMAELRRRSDAEEAGPWPSSGRSTRLKRALRKTTRRTGTTMSVAPAWLAVGQHLRAGLDVRPHEDLDLLLGVGRNPRQTAATGEVALITELLFFPLLSRGRAEVRVVRQDLDSADHGDLLHGLGIALEVPLGSERDLGL
jgi:hypothetical protein